MEIETNIILSAAVQQKHLTGFICKCSTLLVPSTLFKQRPGAGTEWGRVFNLPRNPRFYCYILRYKITKLNFLNQSCNVCLSPLMDDKLLFCLEQKKIWCNSQKACVPQDTLNITPVSGVFTRACCMHRLSVPTDPCYPLKAKPVEICVFVEIMIENEGYACFEWWLPAASIILILILLIFLFFLSRSNSLFLFQYINRSNVNITKMTLLFSACTLTFASLKSQFRDVLN